VVAALEAGAAALRQAQADAQVASSGLSESVTELAYATEGSAIAELPLSLDRVRQDVDDFARQLSRLADRITAYRESLDGPGTPDLPPADSPRPPSGAPGRRGVHTTMPTSGPPQDERADELRSELPPPVQKGGAHQKTHGRWLTPNADAEAQTLTSGKDEMSQATEQFLRNNGLAGRGMPSAVYDVEMKLAVHMATNGITHAAVTINNTPCIGPFSCDRLLPKILPPGTTLDVHGTTADGRATYKRYGGTAT